MCMQLLCTGYSGPGKMGKVCFSSNLAGPVNDSIGMHSMGT